MKKLIWFSVSIIIIGGGLLFLRNGQLEDASPSIPNIMTLQSSAFKHNGEIPAQYTCDGENVNPPLTIADVPVSAKSLALIIDDPDAPLGTWVHWTLWNIHPNTNFIAGNTVPSNASVGDYELPLPATEGVTSFKKPGYGGPCPPSGVHRYFFKLYALDTILSLPPATMKVDLEKAMEGHILSRGELVGTYKKK